MSAEKQAVRAVVFDLYETLITYYHAPVYFGAQIAADTGVPEDAFLSMWRQAESDRSTGKLSLEAILERILKKHGKYSSETVEEVVRKRIRVNEEAYRRLHPEVLPLLTALKERGIRIGLISNCFSEEAQVLRASVLYPFFDAPCLSYDERVEKPDPEIFRRCLARLGVPAEACLYVGDGGSRELETAEQLGMRTAQAVWYLKESAEREKRKPGFAQLETPLAVLERIASL